MGVSQQLLVLLRQTRMLNGRISMSLCGRNPDCGAASRILRSLTLSHILDGAKVPIDNSLDNGIALEQQLFDRVS